jgi:hypothetical protein
LSGSDIETIGDVKGFEPSTLTAISSLGRIYNNFTK